MRRRIATSALILMATLLLLASLPPTRILLPLPSALVQQLTGLLASRLGVSLRLGAVSLHLDGAKPSLVMYELGLADPDGEADRLSAERIEISLAVGDSLRAGGVVIERLHLVGARLAVRIDPSGRISLDGLDAPIAGHADWLAPLLQTPRIDLEGGQILIKDARPHHPGWMLDALQLGIARDGTQHRLRLDAVPGLRARGSDSATGDSRDQAVAHLAVRAQLTGERTDPNTWSGLLHVSLKADDLAGLLAQDIPETRLARHARGHIQGWIDLQAGRLAQALGAIDLRPGEPCAHAKREHDQSPSAGDLHLESMRAMARLEPEDTGWRVMIGALDGRIAGLPLPAGTLELRLSPAGRPEQLRIRGDRIELALLATLAESLQRFVSPSMLAIARAGPWGRLERIDARAEWLAPTGARWSVAARGVGVGWRHTGMRPGVDGLDLRILATADGGALILDTAAAELDLGGRRDEPLPPTHLAGALTWRHTTSGGIWLSGQDLVITSTDLRGGGDFALHLPPGEAPADLDLRASIQSADAARIHAYLPRELMPPRLVSWLSKAIVAGQITGGDLRVRGHPVDLPFQGDEGRFELRLDFADAILDYRPGWPALRELAGQLRIRDQSLDIVAERGRIFDSSLTRVEASLPRLRGPAPLHIQGTAEGPFADTLRALAETPLATRLGRLAESLVVSGDSHLELEMDLPLRQAAPLALSGRVSWPRAATLAIPGTPIELSELAGTLTFTRDRLATEDLRGLLWGQPADLQIATRGADGSLDTAALLISARSRTSTQQLAEHFPHPLWAALSGALDWTLDLELPGHALHTATPTLAYRLSSQLRGLASALPAPLGKTAATSTELDLAGTLTPGSAMRLTGRLGTVGAAVRIALDVPSADPRAWQGHLRLGSDTAPSPRGVGIHLDGQMPELDLPAWLTTLHTYWPEVLAPGQPPGRPWLNGADIRVDRLSIGQARLSSAHLKMTPHETPGRGGWNLEVNAEQGAGQIALNPDDEVPLDVVLRRLSLRDLRVTPASRETASLDALGRVPAARVRVDDLRWGETRLGTLELTLRPDSGGLEIPSIRLSGDGLVDAHGKAHWRRSAHDSHSELSMHIDSDDPGRLLAALGGRAHIELESMQARMILDWPGGFGAFAPRRATGLIEIDLGAGRLLALEPGIGRLLGILNLDAARRRLAMDFTDLYGDGFAFEAVRGRIRLDQGRADLRDVTIDGPSSRLLVDGSSDLINERLDQIVIVEPKLGSSVALASAVAGGPIVGAAVYLVDRLAGNPLDRLGRSRYRVTGPWSAPEVIRIGWEPALAPTLTTGHDGANPPTGDANLFLD